MPECHVCASMVDRAWAWLPPCAPIPRPDPSPIPTACAGMVSGPFALRQRLRGRQPSCSGWHFCALNSFFFFSSKGGEGSTPPTFILWLYHSRFGSPQLTIYRTARYSFGRRLAPRAPFCGFPTPFRLWFVSTLEVCGSYTMFTVPTIVASYSGALLPPFHSRFMPPLSCLQA